MGYSDKKKCARICEIKFDRRGCMKQHCEMKFDDTEYERGLWDVVWQYRI